MNEKIFAFYFHNQIEKKTKKNSLPFGTKIFTLEKELIKKTIKFIIGAVIKRNSSHGLFLSDSH